MYVAVKSLSRLVVHPWVSYGDAKVQPTPPPSVNDEFLSPVPLRVIYPKDLLAHKFNPTAEFEARENAIFLASLIPVKCE